VAVFLFDRHVSATIRARTSGEDQTHTVRHPNIATPQIQALYLEEGWTLRQIAEHFNITLQAVHYRLKTAGHSARSRGPRPREYACDPAEAKRLYVEELQPMKKIAAELKVPLGHVVDALDRAGVERRRGAPRIYHQLGELGVGDALVVAKPTCKGKWHSIFYDRARSVGIKLSVRSLGDLGVRLTRVA
jgi:hypothetical protein